MRRLTFQNTSIRVFYLSPRFSELYCVLAVKFCLRFLFYLFGFIFSGLWQMHILQHLSFGINKKNVTTSLISTCTFFNKHLNINYVLNSKIILQEGSLMEEKKMETCKLCSCANPFPRLQWNCKGHSQAQLHLVFSGNLKHTCVCLPL